MSTQSSTTTGATLGKIIAGFFLHDFREGGKSGNQMIQQVSGKLKKYIGPDQTKAIYEGSEKMHVTLISACIDYAILERLTDESQKLMSELEDTERVMTEIIFLHVTGRSPIKQDRSDTHWLQPLWNFRKTSTHYLELSPTGVKDEEFAQAIKEVLLSAMLAVREQVIKSL